MEADPETSIHLEAPSAAREEHFLRSARRSRALHRGLVHPPLSGEAYRNWLKRQENPAQASYLLCNEREGLVGVVSVNEIVRGSFQSAYLGYYLFTPHTGKGFMAQGLRLVIMECFSSLRLHRLEANIQPHNTASIAVVERLGFSMEGYSPRYLKIGGRWRDHQRWALLKEIWRGA